MAGTLVVPVVDEGLGNSAYLAVLTGGPPEWPASAGVALEDDA